MAESNEQELQAWEEDVNFLVNVLKECFESDNASYYVDELNEILYVELEGLDEYSEEEIIEIAEPVLGELYMDFEDIILIPLKNKK